MNRVLTFTILASLFLFTNTASAALEVTIEEKPKHLGERFRLFIRSDTEQPGIAGLDVSALGKNFEIYEDARASGPALWDGISKPTFSRTLTLYPKKTGRFSIPAFQHADQQSQALVVEIKEVSAALPEITMTVSASKSRFLMRETVYFTASISYPIGADLKIKPAALARNSSWYSRMSVAKTIGQDVTETISWTFSSFRSGRLRLSLPAIEIKFRQRVKPLRFFPEPLDLSILPVPAWLPDSVHVGPINIIAGEFNKPAFTGQPDNWIINVEADGLSQSTIEQALLNDLYASDVFKFYPADFQHRRLPGRGWIVTIPFTPLSQGDHLMPRLRFQYFDPDSRKLMDAILASRPLPVKSKFVQGAKTVFLWLVALVLMAVVLFNLGRRIHATILCARYKKQIAQCKSWHEVKKVFREYHRGSTHAVLDSMWYRENKPELEEIKQAANRCGLHPEA